MGNTQLYQPVKGFLLWQQLLQRANLITSDMEKIVSMLVLKKKCSLWGSRKN